MHFSTPGQRSDIIHPSQSISFFPSVFKFVERVHVLSQVIIFV